MNAPRWYWAFVAGFFVGMLAFLLFLTGFQMLPAVFELCGGTR